MTTPEKPAKAAPVKIKPSVGRIVHYHNGTDPRPQAAVIVEVFPWAVDLHVFHPDAGTYNVKEVQHEDDTKSARHWNWPPRA